MRFVPSLQACFLFFAIGIALPFVSHSQQLAGDLRVGRIGALNKAIQEGNFSALSGSAGNLHLARVQRQKTSAYDFNNNFQFDLANDDWKAEWNNAFRGSFEALRWLHFNYISRGRDRDPNLGDLIYESIKSFYDDPSIEKLLLPKEKPSKKNKKQKKAVLVERTSATDLPGIGPILSLSDVEFARQGGQFENLPRLQTYLKDKTGPRYRFQLPPYSDTKNLWMAAKLVNHVRERVAERLESATPGSELEGALQKADARLVEFNAGIVKSIVLRWASEVEQSAHFWVEQWAGFNDSFLRLFGFALDLRHLDANLQVPRLDWNRPAPFEGYYQNVRHRIGLIKQHIIPKLIELEEAFDRQTRELERRGRKPKGINPYAALRQEFIVLEASPLPIPSRQLGSFQVYSSERVEGLVDTLITDLENPNDAWWVRLGIEEVLPPRDSRVDMLDTSALRGVLSALPHSPDVRFLDPSWEGWFSEEDLALWDRSIEELKRLCREYRATLANTLASSGKLRHQRRSICDRLPNHPADSNIPSLMVLPEQRWGGANVSQWAVYPDQSEFNPPYDLEVAVADRYQQQLDLKSLVQSKWDRTAREDTWRGFWSGAKGMSMRSKFGRFQASHPDIQSHLDLFPSGDPIDSSWWELRTYRDMVAVRRSLERKIKTRETAEGADQDRELWRLRFQHVYFVKYFIKVITAETGRILKEPATHDMPSSEEQAKFLEIVRKKLTGQALSSDEQAFVGEYEMKHGLTRREAEIARLGWGNPMDHNIKNPMRGFFKGLALIRDRPLRNGLNINQDLVLDGRDREILELLIELFKREERTRK